MKANICEIRVVALIKAGWYMNEIANNFNAAPATIQKIANDHQLKFKKYLADIDESKESKLIDDLLINKVRVEKLLSKYNISRDLLKRILKRNGIPYPAKDSDFDNIKLEIILKNKLPEIKHKYEETDQEGSFIAKSYGISKSALYRLAKTRGWVRKIWKRKHFKDIWKRDLGESDGNEKYQEYLKLNKQSCKGSENPMYGKPSPRGSGNGWKGWFKGEYFRSLRELSFLIYLNDNNIKYESAERKKYTIKYFWEGSERTYRPDFIIGNILYEIKPQRLINSPNVKAKTEAAKEFCIKNGLEYKIMDFDIQTGPILTHLQLGNVEFTRNYFEKFMDFVNRQKTHQGLS